MQTRNRNTFTTIHTEGALLPVDLLQRISDNDSSLEGLNPESYHLAPGEKINEAINRSWNRMNGLWGVFKTSRSRLGPNDAGTTLTRERWLLPLFQELSFGRLSTSKAIEIEGKSYPISHRWQNIPIHLVGCGLDLDKRTPGVAGASRISPHSLLQEYLNRDDEAQWGLLSNGLRLRVLRDNATLTRQAYLEFDLESIFEGEVYSDFVLLWLIGHQSRFETAEKQSECLLERWSKSAQERGTRALDDLRRGVEEAIVSLGQGFLQHPLNADLRGRLKKGELPAQDYYRQLLRLVYRLIFLFAAEDRDLLLIPDAAPEAKERYKLHYSTARLRALAERQRGSRHHDRYEAMRLLMTLLSSDKGCPELAIPALGGFLFDPRSTADLNEARLDNQSLLIAVRSLAFITERNTRRAVDYRNLGPEELGSVYESLLELHPLLNIEAGTFQLTSAAGNERKTTGSYYTPTSLIRVLLDSALDPVIEDRLKGKADAAQQEKALLDLKVCDPACGSGHFLIAAAHRIAGRLAQARAGGDEPPPNETRRALRDVIRHCIYGVDINPMSVELCKVNLWLESLEPGKPLSFLDAHIQCGNSLVGVGPNVDIKDLEVPEDAFNPVTGDDKKAASALKKVNREAPAHQLGFQITLLDSHADLQNYLANLPQELDQLPEDTTQDVQRKAEQYRDWLASGGYQQQQLMADLWTAAFFWPIAPDTSPVLAPVQGNLRKLQRGQSIPQELAKRVMALAQELNFFHWSLAFPQVFTDEPSGFDCVLGNPPWERIKLQEEEFFASRDPEIAAAPNKAARQKLIDGLVKSNPELGQAFTAAKHAADCTSKFMRAAQRYPLTAVGDVNTYALFSEHFCNLMNRQGRAGVIVPTGIATDDSTKDFFGDLVEKRAIASLFDFENREKVFPAVDSRMKFSLLTLSGKPLEQAKFVFFATSVENLRDQRRNFSLTHDEISLINPNTRTMPIFRAKADAAITKKIYQSAPVLVNERTEVSPWSIYYMRLVDLSDHANFLRFPWQDKDSTWNVSLYEAKLMGIYDHRYSTFADCSQDDCINGKPRELSILEKQDTNVVINPRYFIPLTLYDELFQKYPNYKHNWLFVWRDVARATDERTCIATAIPKVVASRKLPALGTNESSNPILLLANFNSIVFDYVVRQKIGNISFSFFILKQLPALPPNFYSVQNIDFIMPRVLELIYTANDMKPFAEDIGYHGEPFLWNEDRRALLRAELDAYYARLYGLNRKQLRYMLDPADLTPRELEDILDPWEEVADPLDPQGYAQRGAASDFPGETFRVLKEKEIKQYGEYRTRRLVLEAWERLSASGWVDSSGTAPLPKADRRPEPAIEVRSQPVVEPVREEPKPVKREPAVKEQEKEETPMQPALSDFGLYKCSICGKMVMGFEKSKHEQEKHRSQPVEWKKMR